MPEVKRKNSSKKKSTKIEKRNFGGVSSAWGYLIIFLFSFVLYANTIEHDYALDDDMFTKKNSFVQKGFSALPQIFSKSTMYGFNGRNDANYRPMVLVNFVIEKSFWGNNPHVNHFFNVLLFSLTCLLLYHLLKKLLKAYSSSFPLLITLLFLFHPIHTEVVANIKSRDEILGLLFGLLSSNFIIDYFDKKNFRYLILSLLMFFLASLSKESAITFAAIAPLMIFFFRNEPIKKIFFASIPFFVLIGIYWALRMHVTDSVTQSDKISTINNSLMAATNATEMYATNFVMLGKYIQLLFFPHPLSWDYSYRQFPIVPWTNIPAIISLVAYAGMGVFIIIRTKKKDVLAFAMLFYLITIFPTSNLLVKFGATIAERFLYTPSIGFCIAIPFLVSKIFNIPDIKTRLKNGITYSVFALILLLFGIKTYSQNKVWANNFTLFTAGVKAAPNSARTHSSLASEYRDMGEESQNPVAKQKYLNTAVAEYQKAIEIFPTSDTYYNLGVVYYDLGDNKNSKDVYEKSIAMNSTYAPAYNNLGVIYIANKDFEEATKNLQLAIKADSTYADAYANLGVVYHNLGKLQQAIPMYEKSIEFNPGNVNVYSNLSKLYLSLGDKSKSEYYSSLTNRGRK